MRSDQTHGTPPSAGPHRESGTTPIRRSPRPLSIPDDSQIGARGSAIPFRQRPTCTIKEACKASGLGRTKFYELIKGGQLTIISIGRRRLVQVPSLLKLLRMEDP